jgi:EAL domain-containing protein (putative c-di-GMP-specific phosphodiesterase class I)
MVTSVIVMAKCLGIKTVAEGIETEAELEFLRSINCDAFQGYLISKPMPVDVMTEWLGLFGPKEHKNLSKNVLEDVAVSKAKAA